jgi:hypothetical protein
LPARRTSARPHDKADRERGRVHRDHPNRRAGGLQINKPEADSEDGCDQAKGHRIDGNPSCLHRLAPPVDDALRPSERSTICAWHGDSNQNQPGRAGQRELHSASPRTTGKGRGRKTLRAQVRLRAGRRSAAGHRELVGQAKEGEKSQVLLGVTGSGKTFTMAKVIEALQRPALVIAPNKILAAQLYGEFRSFFPDNAVEYFVSYYDYYQPEAYVPRTDTYIEKESSVNEAIDRMRHSATRSLLERDDVIIVASVSAACTASDRSRPIRR